MAEDRGFTEGALITLVLGAVSSILVGWISFKLLNPIAGWLLILITVSIVAIYFGKMGLRNIAVGRKAIGLWLGKRTGKIYPEGWIWTWPHPFGDIIEVDIRERPLPLPLSKVVTADNVEVNVEATLQIQVSDINVYLSADKPEISLTNNIGSDVRASIAKYQSDNVAQEKVAISESLQNGGNTPGTPLERTLLRAIQDAPGSLGITVKRIAIQNIDIPAELEKARTEVKVAVAQQAKEAAQKVAETTEANHVAAMIEIYKRTGLSAKEAADIAQTERKKAERIIIDGGAKPIVQAGALVGRNLSSKSSPAPSTDPDSKKPKK